MGYLQNTIAGVTWMATFRVITRIFSFLRLAILARLLTPSQFGFFGIASIMLILLEILTQTGVNVFLIQEKKKLKEYVNIAWTISILRGFIISLSLIILSPIISQYFNAPESQYLIKLIASVAFMRGFINPSRIKFLKNLTFNKEVWFGSVVFAVDFSVAILFAYILRDPSSLIWGLIMGALTELVLSFLLIKPTPRLEYNRNKLLNVFNRGKWVTGSGIFTYLFEQGDDIVVGRLLNSSALGIYQVAYKIAILPFTEVTKMVNQVTFPIYTRIARDRVRLKNAFIKTMATTILIVLPMGIVVYTFPKQIVSVLLGSDWVSAIPIIKVLSIFGVVRAVSFSTIPLFDSLKKQQYVTLVSFVSFFAMMITIVPFTARWGILGASRSVLVGSFAVLPVIYVCMKNVLSKYNKYNN